MIRLGTQNCRCCGEDHEPRLIVVTGGPGAGKTAVLEMARRTFCEHVGFLPEAATVVFGGGFPRGSFEAARCAAQRAIFCVQREMETVVVAAREVDFALCDRGTLDGAAYWPTSPELFWKQLGSSPERELARYHAVVHLETPPADNGYNQDNPLRIESAAEAQVIDRRIAELWSEHPRLHVVPSTDDFLDKTITALEILRTLIAQPATGDAIGAQPPRAPGSR
jgi:predicted ATPase